MAENLLHAGNRYISDIVTINRDLVEKTLRMRCLAYLHQVKSELLTQTIHCMKESKQCLARYSNDLLARTSLLERQQAIISEQKEQLQIRNLELQEARNSLENIVHHRTRDLRKANRQLKQEIEEKRQIADRLRDQAGCLRQYAKAFESASDGLMITDGNGSILCVNPAFTRITGYAAGEAVGRNASLLKSDRQPPSFYQNLWRSLLDEGRWQGEIWDRRKDGSVFPAWCAINRVENDGSEAEQYVGLLKDISDIKDSEQRMRQLAHHDALTQLPNRLLLGARLEHCMQQAQRDGHKVALLFIDLDRFKTINDSEGHLVGDQLLMDVAIRLVDTVRKEDTVARISGDEFIIVLGQINDLCDVQRALDKILAGLRGLYQLGEREYHISASIGVSLYPDNGSDITTLMRNADTAMYRAKHRGGDNYCYYAAEMTTAAMQRLAMENDLRRALELGQFSLVYQPQIDSDGNEIIGLEVLLRWQHPEQGMISPDRFIPIAEETGLIREIGFWVIETACREANTWVDQGILDGRLAINVSPQQVRDPAFFEQLLALVTASGFPLRQLELEITESLLIQHSDHLEQALKNLTGLGVSLAIDDFGTGYSSLGYLKRYPIELLKIDRSFIRDILSDPEDQAIVAAIIGLARGLGISVLAEGVETAAQARRLQELDCGRIQGYLFSKPLPAPQVRTLLQAHAPQALSA